MAHAVKSKNYLNYESVPVDMFLPKEVREADSEAPVKFSVPVKFIESIKSASAEYSFQKNGFAFVSGFNAGFELELEEYARFLGKIDHNPRNLNVSLIEIEQGHQKCIKSITACLRRYLEKWAKDNTGFNPKAGDVIVPLAPMHYREQNLPEHVARKFNRPLHYVHSDFTKENLNSLFKKRINENKPIIESLLGKKLSTEEFLGLEIIQGINVWLSLNFKATTNTLALLDAFSVDLSKDSITYESAPQELMTSIYPNANQQWVALKSIKVCQGIIFNSFSTFHTAVDFNSAETSELEPRRNVEWKVVIIRAPKV